MKKIVKNLLIYILYSNIYFKIIKLKKSNEFYIFAIYILRLYGNIIRFYENKKKVNQHIK